jgi:Predicted transcriptional regulator
MEELAGFINGNVNRRKILEILDSKGAADAGKISKIARIIPPATAQILEDLSSRHLVQKTDDKYSLTEDGKIIIDFIRAL